MIVPYLWDLFFSLSKHVHYCHGNNIKMVGKAENSKQDLAINTLYVFFMKYSGPTAAIIWDRRGLC